MTQVRIPPVLRESAGGIKQVELPGATVGDVLEQLVDRYPGLRAQLFTEEGELNRFVNVYLNEEDVRYLSELDTPAVERDTIVVLPAMAGGVSVSQPIARGHSRSFAGRTNESRSGSSTVPPAPFLRGTNELNRAGPSQGPFGPNSRLDHSRGERTDPTSSRIARRALRSFTG